MPVHHVDVDPVGARLVDGAHLLAEPGELGREDGGGDADGLLHAGTLTLPESRGKESPRLIPALLRVEPASSLVSNSLSGIGPVEVELDGVPARRNRLDCFGPNARRWKRSTVLSSPAGQSFERVAPTADRANRGRMTMLKNLDRGRIAALAAAVATAGLMVPAPAQAQAGYNEACVQYYIEICEANWQSMGFPSAAKCAYHHKETVCKGEIYYPDDYLVPPSAERLD
jgi:hypothetical protein